MKRQKLKNWAFVLLIIILISNIPPIKSVIGLFMDEYHYRYSNEDGAFTFVEFKSRDQAMMFRKFESFKIEQTEKSTTVYRLFWKNPFAFWRWGEYFYDKRYKLPYKSWKEIRKRRGYDLEYSTNWQDF